jgi:hypothetical protein
MAMGYRSLHKHSKKEDIINRVRINNISVILWWSVLLVEKSRVSEENRHAADH